MTKPESEEITIKKLLALFAVITIAFTGCSLKKDRKAADEMPPDKPWNRFVLETDNGYYYPVEQGMMALRYSEKSNGTDIFLCAKPECQHSGEPTCTATYNFYSISNYVLYDGFIYFAADDSDKESFAYSLYKVSLDGSSLDKVSEIIRVKSTQSSDNNGWGWGGLADICIHKGYAYIPYTLGHSSDYAHYNGQGIARVNVQTGESELLFSHDDFVKSFSYGVECGIGDHVYYNRYKNGKFDYFRYNIKTGESEEITGELGEILDDTDGHTGLAAFTENACYMHYYDGKKETLTSYDINTFKKTDFVLDLKVENNSYFHKTKFYDNKIFVIKLKSIDVYSDTGELLGSHSVPSYLAENESESPYSFDFRQFDISNDKMYMSYYDNMDISGFEYKNGNAADDDTDAFYSVYSCSIDDVISGKGDWEKQYSIKHSADYWNENVEVRPANSY